MDEQEAAEGLLNLSVAKRVILPTLPHDLVINILEGLPAKSLLRFKCVSKLWYNQIKQSTFINKHYLQRKVNGRLLLMCRFLENKHVLSFHDLDSEELDEVGPNLPIPYPVVESLHEEEEELERTTILHGPCNGLVCMLRGGTTQGGDLTGDEQIILCNPTLREFKHLPLCPFECPQDLHACISGSGFGNNCSNTELKIVLIRYLCDPADEFAIPPYIVVHLYSSSTNSWREVDSKNSIACPTGVCQGIFLNGSCHWLANTRFECSFPVTILCFNMDNDGFRQLEYPDSRKGKYRRDLTVLNERLTLIRYDEDVQGEFEVWMMKEYGVESSWIKQFVMRSSNVITHAFCWINNSRLLMEESDGRLACTEPLTKRVKKFQLYWNYWTSAVIIYEESLISLNQFFKSS